MWQAIGLLGLVVALVGLVAAIRPMAALWIPTRGRAAGLVLLGLIAFVVGAVNDTPSTPTATPTGPNDALRARIEDIVNESRGTLITFTVTTPDQQRDTVEVEWQAPSGFVAARVWTDTKDVLRAIHQSGLGTGGMIWVRVRLPARDVHGTATTVPGLNLLFDPMELQGVQWDTVRPENLAKIASRTIAVHRDLQ